MRPGSCTRTPRASPGSSRSRARRPPRRTACRCPGRPRSTSNNKKKIIIMAITIIAVTTTIIAITISPSHPSICVYMCIHIYIYIYTHIYINIYIYIYTYPHETQRCSGVGDHWRTSRSPPQPHAVPI